MTDLRTVMRECLNDEKVTKDRILINQPTPKLDMAKYYSEMTKRKVDPGIAEIVEEATNKKLINSNNSCTEYHKNQYLNYIKGNQQDYNYLEYFNLQVNSDNYKKNPTLLNKIKNDFNRDLYVKSFKEVDDLDINY